MANLQHTTYLKPKNEPPKAPLNQNPWAGETEAALTSQCMCPFMTPSFDKLNVMVPKTTRDAAKEEEGQELLKASPE